MYKGECLNPQLLRIISQTGHTDMIGIVDAGFPIPQDVERVDLIWKKGEPKWLDVCKFLKENIVVEKIYLAEEIRQYNSEMEHEFEKIFKDVKIEYIPHAQLKSSSKMCRGIIRTGEFNPFCNCLMVAGVNF